MTDPGLTGERQHFSSDCDANTFYLMRDASMDLVGLGSGLVPGPLQSWHSKCGLVLQYRF